MKNFFALVLGGVVLLIIIIAAAALPLLLIPCGLAYIIGKLIFSTFSDAPSAKVSNQQDNYWE